MRAVALAMSLLFALLAPAAAAPLPPALVPAPQRIAPNGACAPLVLDHALTVDARADDGGFELLRERWHALGIAAPRRAARGEHVDVVVRSSTALDGSYTLRVCGASASVMLEGGDGEGRFDALATLAQLPVRDGSLWLLPPVAIVDKPALRWRIVSDDVSRGPFPSATYARARIRALAALKINGWSPYMEHVLRDPRAPYVASPDGWTPADLASLAAYARRFHVTLIPEQQTFAHMHETLKWETYAPLAELPHGYLLAPGEPQTYAYLGPLVRSAANAARPTPFVHVGGDEPLDLGRGRTPRTAAVFAAHIRNVEAFLDGTGARPMIWDDSVQQDPAILGLLPRPTVIVSFHYGAEASFRRYLDPVAAAGFDQMVAPGAANWTELYPDLKTAYANTARFTADGRALARGMLGMFFTVWHDDGETLFEATWPAVAFAAASAWQATPVDAAGWHATFARAFFGSDDPGYARDLDTLRTIRTLLRTSPSDPIDYLYWHDPFDPALQARASAIDVRGVRLDAESVLAHLWDTHPPLHPDAAQAMRLGALRYDQLGRRLQIGAEVRSYYDDARAHAATPSDNIVYRGLFVAKYLCWEMRDALTLAERFHADAWRAENTPGGWDRIAVRYRRGETEAQACADRLDAAAREDELRRGALPAFDELMGLHR